VNLVTAVNALTAAAVLTSEATGEQSRKLTELEEQLKQLKLASAGAGHLIGLARQLVDLVLSADALPGQRLVDAERLARQLDQMLPKKPDAVPSPR
jgi:hypothetical protein